MGERRTALATAAGGLSLLVGATGTARAHVRFVAGEAGAGDAVRFVLATLSEPLAAALVGGAGLTAVAAALAYLRIRPARRDVAVFRETMAGYADLLPWLLRLGFGLPLVGAGFAGYLFNPAVSPLFPGGALTRLFQILLGFLLLFGLATRATALVGLGAYLALLPVHPDLLFSLEYVAGFAGVVLLGSGRPSADHVLRRVAAAEGTVYGEVDPVHRVAAWLDDRLDPYEAYLPAVVRAGTGLTFLFLGVVEKLVLHEAGLAVVDRYDLTSLLPVAPELWVVGAGLTEAGLGLLLLLGAFTRAASLVAILVFVATLFGLPDDPVLAHVGLFSLVSALLITGSGPYAVDNRLPGWIAPGEPRRAGDPAED